MVSNQKSSIACIASIQWLYTIWTAVLLTDGVSGEGCSKLSTWCWPQCVTLVWSFSRVGCKGERNTWSRVTLQDTTQTLGTAASLFPFSPSKETSFMPHTSGRAHLREVAHTVPESIRGKRFTNYPYSEMFCWSFSWAAASINKHLFGFLVLSSLLTYHVTKIYVSFSGNPLLSHSLAEIQSYLAKFISAFASAFSPSLSCGSGVTPAHTRKSHQGKPSFEAVKQCSQSEFSVPWTKLWHVKSLLIKANCLWRCHHQSLQVGKPS